MSGTRAISTTSKHELSSSSPKSPKEIHAILTETLGCFLRGRVKDLTAPLYIGYLHITTPLDQHAGCVLCKHEAWSIEHTGSDQLIEWSQLLIPTLLLASIKKTKRMTNQVFRDVTLCRWVRRHALAETSNLPACQAMHSLTNDTARRSKKN